jgi:hypothetical protein
VRPHLAELFAFFWSFSQVSPGTGDPDIARGFFDEEGSGMGFLTDSLKRQKPSRQASTKIPGAN